MAKLTIEIDMDDPQEIWDALYRRIEDFVEDPNDKAPKPTTSPATYDLLLDPERCSAEAGEYFAVFSGRE